MEEGPVGAVRENVHHECRREEMRVRGERAPVEVGDVEAESRIDDMDGAGTELRDERPEYANAELREQTMDPQLEYCHTVEIVQSCRGLGLRRDECDDSVRP